MRNFNDIYYKIKSSDCSDLLKMYKKDMLLKIFFTVLFIGFILLIYNLEIELVYKNLFLMSSIILFIILIRNFHLRSYSNLYKKYVISKIIENFDESFRFNPQYSISPSTYLDGDFEQHFDRYHSEDCILGKFNKTFPFEMGEVKTEVKYEDYDIEHHTLDRSYHTLFDGLFIKIKQDKVIPCTIYIRKKLLFSKSLFVPSNKTLNKKNIANTLFEEIDMDDSDFEKLYFVKTDNRILTMQIFTSSLLRYIVDFKTKYKIIPEITIKKEKIYLRFSINTTLFEPHPLKSPLSYSEVQRQYIFINSIMQICKDLIKNINEIEL